MRFFYFAIDDWDGGTKALTLAERGAYMAVLCQIYRHEGPVRLSGAKWAALMNCSRQQAERHIAKLIWLGKLIKGPDNSLVNKKAVEVLNQWRVRSLLKGVGKRKCPPAGKNCPPAGRTNHVTNGHNWGKVPEKESKYKKKGPQGVQEALQRLKQARENAAPPKD